VNSVISMTYHVKHLLPILTLARPVILIIPGKLLIIEQSSLIRIPGRPTLKFSVKVAGPTLWNNLPADIVNAPLIYLFKRHLSAYVLTLND